jgi:hypothetical protein
VPELLPDPDTVTHGAFAEAAQLQPPVVVTVIVPVAPVGGAVMSVGESVIEHVELDSLTVNDFPAIVRVALLPIVPVLAAAV